MLSLQNRTANDDRATRAALDRSLAIIEFDLDGHVITANANFLATLGYDLSEIQGRHHSLFVAAGDAETEAYRAFWTSLRAGAFQAGQYKRLAKGGREVWIEASYNPVLDRRGQPYKIVKLATDITAQKLADAERAGQISAIGKSQAVISFDLDGTVLDANANFLTALGYRLSEIVGQHHRMFVTEETASDLAYAEFWANLRAGAYQAGQFKRLAKGGRAVWIEASYNPILDASGRPYKVVKFATDVSAQVGLLADLRRLIEQNFGAIDAAVGHTRDQSGAAALAVETTSGTVQTMAAASEELAASISEIAQSMAKSRAATDQAHAEVETAGTHTVKLAGATEAIGGVVGLIQSIAGQINLLALNATIEAARAGAAGRGFAVVAAEVKALASQAARATGQITTEIENVQTVSQQVVDALATIAQSVDAMRDTVVCTASAVEEQSVVTQEMSAGMQAVARTVADISSNLTAIAGSVTGVSEAVIATKDAVRVLAR